MSHRFDNHVVSHDDVWYYLRALQAFRLLASEESIAAKQCLFTRILGIGSNRKWHESYEAYLREPTHKREPI